MSNVLNATITSRTDLTRDLIILRFHPDNGIPVYRPGQYIALGLPGSAPRASWATPEHEAPDPDKIIKRAYSLASTPQDSEALEVFVALLPEGLLTSRLALITPGQRIFAAPKITGTFTMHDVPSDHNLVLVGTGTGLAPFISMIRDPKTWTANRSVTIIHGVRKSSDLGYRDEILKVIQTGKPLRYLPYVSRENDLPRDIYPGRVSQAITENLVELNPDRDHVFLCGNPAMIEELELHLVGRGYVVHSKKHPGSLHIEKYW